MSAVTCRIVLASICLAGVWIALCQARSMSPISLTRVQRDTATITTQQIKWWTIANCIKARLGASMVTNKNVRCAAREMFSVFRTRERTPCKHCDSYFFCVANSNAQSRCSGHHALDTAQAISECQDIRGDSEEIVDASDFGRGGGNCNNMYLFSSGCKFAPSNETCSSVCH